mmetsp:Transcript_5779/g.8862  ORF Transcript_5779/g.8862 Transcript_5779/m.8862 type:complete len:80 (+) Transcript_5779:704-943(+)
MKFNLPSDIKPEPPESEDIIVEDVTSDDLSDEGGSLGRSVVSMSDYDAHDEEVPDFLLVGENECGANFEFPSDQGVVSL